LVLPEYSRRCRGGLRALSISILVRSRATLRHTRRAALLRATDRPS
jgi:hypothetical protein